MPCSADFCKQQIRRFAGLRSFPDVPEAATELVNALTSAPSEDAATRFVSEWLRSNTDAPRPADLYGYFDAESNFPDAPPLRLHPLCPSCDDTGFIIVERGGLTAAKPCACRTSKQN